MDRIRQPLGAHRCCICRRWSRARQQGRPVSLQRQRIPRSPIRGVQDARRSGQRELPLPRRRTLVLARQQRRRSARLSFVARRSRCANYRSPAQDQAAHRSRRWRRRTGRWRTQLRPSSRRLRPDATHHTRRIRHLHALHRRHHRHAQGRDVRDGRHDRRLHHQRFPTGRRCAYHRGSARGICCHRHRRRGQSDHQHSQLPAHAWHGLVAWRIHPPPHGWQRHHIAISFARQRRTAHHCSERKGHQRRHRGRLVREAHRARPRGSH